MGGKPTLSIRLDQELWDRFEAYRKRRGLNKTRAGENLLDVGLEVEESMEEDALEAVVERRESEARMGQAEEIETRPLSRTEEWCRDRFESWFAGTLLSATATLSLLLVFSAANLWPGLDPAAWLPTQLLSVVIFVGVVVFLTLLLGTIVTGLLVRTGYAQRIDDWREHGAIDREVAA